MNNLRPSVSIEVRQQDWIPGFAACHNDGSVDEGGPVHVTLNLGSLLSAVNNQDIDPDELPYIVAESLMHETIHALEAWARVEFSEERVEALIEQYRAKYGMGEPIEFDRPILYVGDRVTVAPCRCACHCNQPAVWLLPGAKVIAVHNGGRTVDVRFGWRLWWRKLRDIDAAWFYPGGDRWEQDRRRKAAKDAASVTLTVSTTEEGTP